MSLSKALDLLKSLKEQSNEIRKKMEEIDFPYRGTMICAKDNRRLLYDYVIESRMHKELDILFNTSEVEDKAEEMSFIAFKDTVINQDGEFPLEYLDKMLWVVKYRQEREHLGYKIKSLEDYIQTFTKDEVKKIKRKDKIDHLKFLGLL